MIKIGIRFKFILFTSLLIATIGLASSWFFSTQTRKQLEEELKKRGYSLIAQLAQDEEVNYSMRVAQKAFFDEPIRRLRNLDIEQELAYCRVLLARDKVLLEEKEKWIKTEIDKIPVHKNIENITGPIFNVYFTDNGEQFYNFVTPIHKTSIIAEEEFATQIFGLLEEDYDMNKQKFLGIVQIGLTTERINNKMQTILWTRSIPLGFIIVLVGIGISYFIASGVVKPVEHLVNITDKVASGDLSQKVEISSKDEIGLLASQFNQMTENLKQLFNEEEVVTEELKKVNEELSLINIVLLMRNKQLNETQEQLLRNEKLPAKGTLASDLNHELGKPLKAIKYAVFLLKRKLSRKEMPDSDENVIQFLDIMDKEIDRCSRIINDLSGSTRVTKPTRPNSDINEVVNEALSRVEIPENIKLSKNLQPDLPMIMIDAKQIDHALINLIENACQAMEDGGELEISTNALESFIAVEICDSGCGIPEEEVRKIFEPLFTTRQYARNQIASYSARNDLQKNMYAVLCIRKTFLQ